MKPAELSLEEAKRIVLEKYPDAQCIMYPDNSKDMRRGIYSVSVRRFLGWGDRSQQAWLSAAKRIKEGEGK